MKLRDRIRAALDAVTFYISCPECVYCHTKLKRDERAICSACAEKLAEYKERRCSKCAQNLPDCTCTNDYLAACDVRKLFKVYRYRYSGEENVGSNLIFSLKHENRRDVVNFLADELYSAIIAGTGGKTSDFILTAVPRRRKSILKYGYDHAENLAKAVAQRLGVEYIRLFTSSSVKAQKETHGEERRKNAKFKLVNKTADLKGRRIIIFDDIVTTGSSMGKCASLIMPEKPKAVYGATVAIAFRDLDPYYEAALARIGIKM